jgi:Tol biopolymer transport system component
LEEFVKFHIFLFLAIIVFAANLSTVSAQADSVIGQITSSAQESFAGGISGNGRLVVFESTGNVATENPRNADGNREIFIFDYAQRRIFQITDTRSLLTDTTKAATNDNIKVAIVNLRPVISNDGRWIAFGSNANSQTIASKI